MSLWARRWWALGSDPSDKRPLVVDLDGTLLKTDLLFETANQFVTQHPFRSYRLLGWLISGKTTLKARLAEQTQIDPACLPYNEPLVAWLRRQKEDGRHLVLATASHRSVAQLVADNLGIFDEVLATEGDTNLKSWRKRDELVNRYGDRGFDYVGNDAADLPVWGAAERAYLVGSSPRLISRARSICGDVHAVESERRSFSRILLATLRPHQWVKNLLVFVPLFTAHQYGDWASVKNALLAFVAFGLAASSAYLLNDLVDLTHDRHHGRKRRRPFAAGDLGLVWGWLLWPLLAIAAFAITGFMLSPQTLGALGGYFVLTLAYSFWLKQHALVDVLILAGLYTLRIVAGALAIDVPVSFWLLAFSSFLFLSLAMVKRYGELQAAPGAEGQERVRGRGYLPGDLEVVRSLGTGSGCIAVLVLALYIDDSHTAELYRSPRFIWLACPLLLYWISRAWFIAHRRAMQDDPIVFALRDRVSWVVGACFVALFALARLVP